MDSITQEVLRVRGIKELNPVQAEALPLIFEDSNLLVASPTGSGKTLIGEIAMLAAIRKRKKAVYLVPLRALANEKYDHFREYGISVAIRTGDYDSDENGLEKFDLIVATAEKFDAMVRAKPQWLEDVGVVVVDEAHMIGDETRGATYEVLVTRLKEMKGIRLVLLSAVLPNVKDIAKWLGAEFVESGWRPVPLREGVCSYYRKVTHLCGGNPAKIGKRCEMFGCKVTGAGRITFTDGSAVVFVGHAGDAIADAAIDTIAQGGQTLVFVNSRRATKETAQELAAVLPSNLVDIAKLAELAERIEGLGDDRTTAKELADCVRRGCAFHHAGLARDVKKAVEDGFRRFLIKAIASTTTLGAGIDIPARRVIVKSVYRYTKGMGMTPIPRSEFQNLAGRAGRIRYDKYGEALVLADDPGKARTLQAYLSKPLEPVESTLSTPSEFYTHVLSEVCIRGEATLGDVRGFFYKTLAGRDRQRMIARQSDEALQFLLKNGMVQKSGASYSPTVLGTMVNRLYVTPISVPMVFRAFHESRQRTAGDIGWLHLVCSMDNWNARPPSASPDPFNRKDILLGDTDPDAVRSAMMLKSWVDEAPVKSILERYGVGEADLHTSMENAEWLLHAVSRMASVTSFSDVSPEIRKLEVRVTKGIKEELLDVAGVRGIGRVYGRLLWNAGVQSRSALKEAEAGRVAKVLGVKEDFAAKLISGA